MITYYARIITQDTEDQLYKNNYYKSGSWHEFLIGIDSICTIIGDISIYWTIACIMISIEGLCIISYILYYVIPAIHNKYKNRRLDYVLYNMNILLIKILVLFIALHKNSIKLVIIYLE